MFKGFVLARKIIYLGALLVLAALVLRLAWLKPYEIPSSSMAPTLLPGDRVIVNKLSYVSGEPRRGDIVVFKYPVDPERIFIKRVIALEGESFEIKHSQVYINGSPLAESYIQAEQFAPFAPCRVPAGCLLVLGDNRNHSRDSREWGMLSKSNILGRAFYLYFPAYRRGSLQ